MHNANESNEWERVQQKRSDFAVLFFALLLQWTIYDFKHARIAYERRRRNKMHVSVSRSYMANNVPLKYHLICTGIRVRICIIWLFGIVYVYVTKCFARRVSRNRWQMPPNPSCSCVCVCLLCPVLLRLDKLYAFICCSIFRFIFYEDKFSNMLPSVSARVCVCRLSSTYSWARWFLFLHSDECESFRYVPDFFFSPLFVTRILCDIVVRKRTK